MIPVVDDRTGLPGRATGHRRVLIGVGVVTTFGLLAGLVRTAGTSAPERSAAGDWGTLALVLVMLAPAALALIGMDERPWLLVAAGLLLLPMCFLSFSFLFFPLLVPAVLFLTDAIVRPRLEPHPLAQCAGAILSAVLVIAAVVSLFAHQDPVRWSTATQSGSTSDVITVQEALTSIGFLVAALAVAALTPRDGTPRRAG
jgi:hypothetical protein